VLQLASIIASLATSVGAEKWEKHVEFDIEWLLPLVEADSTRTNALLLKYANTPACDEDCRLP
jgi:hypothetical protein